MKIDNWGKLRKMFKRIVVELTAYCLITGLQGILHLREHYSRRNQVLLSPHGSYRFCQLQIYSRTFCILSNRDLSKSEMSSTYTMMECPIDYCFDDCLAIEKVNMTRCLSYTNHISSILTYILNSWYKNNWEIPQKQ